MQWVDHNYVKEVMKNNIKIYQKVCQNMLAHNVGKNTYLWQ